MNRCKLIEEDIIFDSYTDAAKWVIDKQITTNSLTTAKKQIGLAARVGGEKYGFHWENYNEIPTQTNIQEKPKQKQFKINRQKPVLYDVKKYIKWAESEAAFRNIKIKKQRIENYNTSGGIKHIIYKDIPTLYTKENILQEHNIPMPEWNLLVLLPSGWRMCVDILDLAQVTKINIDKNEMHRIINDNMCGEYQIKINENYKEEIQKYFQKFL